MARTILVSTGILVLCIFAQSTWFHTIAVFGVIPDLSLLVLIYISFANVGPEGQLTGFFSGIVQDFMSVAPLGISAFVKTVVGTVYGLIAGNFYVDKILLPFAFGAAGTVLKALAVAVLALLFPAHVHGYAFFESSLWIEAAYNALLAPAVFWLLGFVRGGLVTIRNRQ